MTDLLAAVLTLRPLEASDYIPWLGIGVRAWFLKAVSAANSTLSERLHDGHQLRPYTVSSLLLSNSRRALLPDTPVTIRVTALEDELTRVTRDLMPTLVGTTIVLAGLPFVVEAVTTDAAVHPWAGESTDIDLVQQWSLSANPLMRTIALQFDSPTAFHSKGNTVPFPLPALIFGSLVDRWNAFNQLQLSEDARKFAEESVALTRYQLRSIHIPTEQQAGRSSAEIGFTGYARYFTRRWDRYWVGVLHTLAAYAFYSGMGVNTTLGMGRTAAQKIMVTEPRKD